MKAATIFLMLFLFVSCASVKQPESSLEIIRIRNVEIGVSKTGETISIVSRGNFSFVSLLNNEERHCVLWQANQERGILIVDTDGDGVFDSYSLLLSEPNDEIEYIEYRDTDFDRNWNLKFVFGNIPSLHISYLGQWFLVEPINERLGKTIINGKEFEVDIQSGRFLNMPNDFAPANRDTAPLNSGG